MLHTEFYNVEICEIIELTPKMKRFFLRFPHDVHFQSGQFVIIDFGDLQHQFSTRSYSIADISNGPIIELCVVLKEDGAATPLLFDCKVGDILKTSSPQGRFVLPDDLDPNKDICFICTGTGVAPFRAMIKDLLLFRKFSANIHLYFGCRTQEDILYRTDFEDLQNRFSNFHYFPVLSREKWDGLNGYVHPYYEKVFSSKPEAIFYLCGWTEMLKETRDKLKSFGYTRSDIKLEFYD